MYDELFKNLVKIKAEDDPLVSSEMLRAAITEFVKYLEIATLDTSSREYCIDPAFAQDEKFIFAGTQRQYSNYKADVEVTSSGILFQVFTKVCSECNETIIIEVCDFLKEIGIEILSESPYGKVREFNRSRIINRIVEINERLLILL